MLFESKILYKTLSNKVMLNDIVVDIALKSEDYLA